MIKLSNFDVFGWQILSPQLHPLTEQQQLAVYGLRQMSAQAEDALSQGMEKLQQTLSESLLATADPFAAPDAYGMGTTSAVDKLKALVGFVQAVTSSSMTNNRSRDRSFAPWPERLITSWCCAQADHLRQETLQNMHKILTARQIGRAHV